MGTIYFHNVRIHALASLSLFMLSCGGRAESSKTEGGAAGGSGSSLPGEPNPEEPRGPMAVPPGAPATGCIDGAAGASMVRGLNPEGDFDALAFVALDGEHYVQLVIEQFGEACDLGAVGSSCLLELTERQVGFYAAGSETPRAFIVVEGEDFLALGYAAFRVFLGEIDTPNEAALIAWSEGWQVACSEITFTDDMWILVPDDPTCTGGQGWVSVREDGTVSHSAHCQLASP